MRNDWTKMYQLYAEGMPLSTIAKKFGVSVPSLRTRFKEFS